MMGIPCEGPVYILEKKNSNNDDDDDASEEYEDDVEQPRLIPDIEDAVDANGRLLNQQPAYDKLLNNFE